MCERLPSGHRNGTQARTDSLSDGYRHNVPHTPSDSLSGSMLCERVHIPTGTPTAGAPAQCTIERETARLSTCTGTEYHTHHRTGYSEPHRSTQGTGLRLYAMYARTHTHRNTHSGHTEPHRQPQRLYAMRARTHTHRNTHSGRTGTMYHRGTHTDRTGHRLRLYHGTHPTAGALRLYHVRAATIGAQERHTEPHRWHVYFLRGSLYRLLRV